MKLKILGSGTSTGVPVPGCQCLVCSSKDPKNYRDRTSGLIMLDNGENILIDATPDLRQQAIKNNIKNIDSVLYTHAHADHIFGTDDLRAFNFIKKDYIDCYSTKNVNEVLKNNFYYVFNTDKDYEGGALAKLRLNDFNFGDEFLVNNHKITSIPIKHGTLDITGFRIGDLAYLTDCSFIPEASYALLKGVKKLIVDGLKFEEHKTHFDIARSIEASKKIGAETTYLIHMTHNIDHETDGKKLPENVFFSYDGLEIDFNY